MTTWLLTLKGSDFARAEDNKGPLVIDLRDNNVHSSSVEIAVKKIRQARRREIRLCDVLDVSGSHVLCLYGPVRGTISDVDG